MDRLETTIREAVETAVNKALSSTRTSSSGIPAQPHLDTPGQVARRTSDSEDDFHVPQNSLFNRSKRKRKCYIDE